MRRKRMCIGILWLSFGLHSMAFAGTLYVDAQAKGLMDGSSWSNAFNTLQDALDAAQDGDEIHIAQGIYRPDQGANVTEGDRGTSFVMDKKISLLGGYGGLQASSPDERDIDQYETLLSGDLQDNDATLEDLEDLADDETRLDNSLHVVTAALRYESCFLEGVTVSGGFANVEAVRRDQRGGGMYIEGLCRPTVQRCRFIGNYAMREGGGIFGDEYTEGLVTQCLFLNNVATWGGGMGLEEASAPVIMHSRFLGNLALNYGGGISAQEDCSPRFENCVFSGNYAVDDGGVADFDENIETEWIHCTLYGNTASNGGAFRLDDDTRLYLTNCVVWDNRSPAISYRDGHAVMQNSLVQGGCSSSNCVDNGGNLDQDPFFVNPVGGDGFAGTEDDDLRISENSPCVNAGTAEVISLWDKDIAGKPRMMDHAPDMGAYETSGQALVFSPDTLELMENQTLECFVQLLQAPSTAIHVNLEILGDTQGKLRLSSYSMEFSASNYDQPQTLVIETRHDEDILPTSVMLHLSIPGTFDVNIPVTVWDRDTPEVLYVDSRATGWNTGLSWQDAFIDLQQALAVARQVSQQVCEVRVAQGTYLPTQALNDRYASFDLIDGVTIKGGYAGLGEVDPNLYDPRQYETILSGDLKGDDGLYQSRVQDNSYNVVDGSETGDSAVLQGFTITAGNASLSLGGAGLRIKSHGIRRGPTLIDCLFIRNRSAGDGGAVYCWRSSATFIGCRFVSNFAASTAGALWAGTYSHVRMVNCVFNHNEAIGMAGALEIQYDCEVSLVNCTLTNNCADDYAGVVMQSSSTMNVENCVFWGNRDTGQSIQDAQIKLSEDNPPVGFAMISYSCLEGWDGTLTGEQVISVDPGFIDANGLDGLAGTRDDDLRLVYGSPCIDMGDNSAIQLYDYPDANGCERIIDGQVDLGAYEGGWQALLVTPGEVVCLEGQEALLEVSLAKPITEAVFVTLTILDPNARLVLMGDTELQFTPANYHIPQQIVLQSYEDDNLVSERVEMLLEGAGRSRMVPISIPEMDESASSVLYVDAQANGCEDGQSWQDAFNHLDDAIAIAASDAGVTEIRVAGGVYTPQFRGGNRKVSFSMVDGVSILGGYAGVQFVDPDERDIERFTTILSGDLQRNDEGDVPGTGENALHVIHATGLQTGAYLEGFTITAGHADQGHHWLYETNGAGLFVEESQFSLSQCTFYKNTAIQRGGGIYVVSGQCSIMNCFFVANLAEHGGGVSSSSADLIIENALFNANLAYRGGGVYDCGDSNVELKNCTLYGNFADSSGGGIYCDYEHTGSFVIQNSILWGNSRSYREGIVCDDRAQLYAIWDVDVASCCVQDSSSNSDLSIDNIDQDPVFASVLGEDGIAGTLDDDFRLSPTSPCVDAGDATLAVGALDLAGEPRIVSNAIDMGAYEFNGIIYVDDDAAYDLGPHDLTVSDPIENGSLGHPFDNIQEAIDLARPEDTIMVMPGTYGSYQDWPALSEIKFRGKPITVMSIDPSDPMVVQATVLQGGIVFDGTETDATRLAGFSMRCANIPVEGNHTQATLSHCQIVGNGTCNGTVISNFDGLIENCLITDNQVGGYCGTFPVLDGCDGTLRNCTIAYNDTGICVNSARIENCIIYGNGGTQLSVLSGETATVRYSLIGVAGESENVDGNVDLGSGTIGGDPCFVQVRTDSSGTIIEGDYHLRSAGWRWSDVAAHGSHWVYDAQTSCCIDAGNPNDGLQEELLTIPVDPNGVYGENKAINMGAYGGTYQASMAPRSE